MTETNATSCIATPVPGGVCAAQGFTANGIHCGIKANSDPAKPDLALVVSSTPASAAAVYTTNLVKGAPLLVTAEHISDGTAQAIICNSGNANTCNANGIEVAKQVAGAVAAELGLKETDIVVASTGVIGQPLDPTPIQNALPELAAGLGTEGAATAAHAIMTTDTVRKETAFCFELPAADDPAKTVTCCIGGMAKGSGMIHPNMATMLVFVTTDVAISPKLLQEALSEDVQSSFNMISVDGDTSTNDNMVILANGQAGNAPITEPGADFDAFKAALSQVTQTLCKAIAHDGEGASKLLTCTVSHAKTLAAARTIAKSIICSSLVKTAMFGSDANWGRVLCAIGYSGADVDVTKVNLDFRSAAGTIAVCRDGAGIEFSEEIAKQVLLEESIELIIDLQDGDAEATAWGCDLTYEYVRINGDYRT